MGLNLNIGTGNLSNRFNKQEVFKSHLMKKPKIKSNLGLEKLLTETERKLEKVIKELKITYLDDLLDEYTKLDNFIRQLKWQIAVRKKK